MTYSPKFRGTAAVGASRALDSNYTNGSGGLITKAVAVSTNNTGNILPTDVSDEDSVEKLVGLSGIAIPDAASGSVISAGRLEDVSGFIIGDALYVDVAGGLTTTKPSAGVAGFSVGDFVIFVGIVVKNEFDPSKKDIQLFLNVVGQL
jgi:hypothetical protein